MATDSDISIRSTRSDGGVAAASGGAVGPEGGRSALAAARRRLRVGAWLPALIAFAALVGVWQLVAVHNPLVVPTIPAVARALADQPGLFATNTATTLGDVAVGLAASAVVAFLLAVLMCHVRTLERALMPLAVVLSVTPVVCLAPGFVIAFGFGALPRYLVTGIIVFFPLLVNFLTGLRAVDPRALDMMRSMHASRWEVFLRLRLPSCVPSLLVAARLCFPLALVGAVVAEIVAPGDGRGLGSVIEVTLQESSDLATIYAAVFLLAVLGVLFTVGVVLAERPLLRRYRPES